MSASTTVLSMANHVTRLAARHTADAQSLEELVLVCLDTLAALAREDDDGVHAARLAEAANLVRSEPPRLDDGRLTDREWEVAMLVARGLSNRQIAAELVLSERTIDTHVSHILRKLAVVSRAQIAAWAVQHPRQFRVLP